MTTYYGNLEDGNGNTYFTECEAQDVKMSDNTTAQSKITAIDTNYSTLVTRINALKTQFEAIIDA